MSKRWPADDSRCSFGPLFLTACRSPKCPVGPSCVSVAGARPRAQRGPFRGQPAWPRGARAPKRERRRRVSGGGGRKGNVPGRSRRFMEVTPRRHSDLWTGIPKVVPAASPPRRCAGGALVPGAGRPAGSAENPAGGRVEAKRCADGGRPQNFLAQPGNLRRFAGTFAPARPGCGLRPVRRRVLTTESGPTTAGSPCAERSRLEAPRAPRGPPGEA